jgi:hypothetical protein
MNWKKISKTVNGILGSQMLEFPSGHEQAP